MTDPILIHSDGPVETVTLNRPERLNAMDEALIYALQDYFRGLHDRLDVRVVVLRAAGRAFCAGLDLGSWKNTGNEGAIHHTWRTQRAIATVMQLMRSCPQPIIALAQGAACGGGLSLLLSSDIRFCTPDFRMNAAYIKIGLGGCDMGSSYFLPRLVGSSLASEMILTGRFIHADRALASGFVSAVVESDQLDAAAAGIVDDMLLTAPMGLRLSKDALNRNIDAPGFEAALAIEDRQQVMLSQTADALEAQRAFLDKRRPDYRDR
ncbi:enoyl-CoA hydratase/isomerase family protein [Qipengyuania sp. RANM35]|uniref:enoyl-CoA hydratase/isomerase family protein n=1 Tax=Qipengyuania sp. RANM35 TaxID=3068635 RepID=UPI0034DAC9D6